MELTNEVYASVNKYFSVLSHTGYKSYNEVDKLLVFIFIEELLSNYSEYIDINDYNLINNAIQCLYGTCMIPYPDYKRSADSVVHRMPDRYRVNETLVLRDTEDNILRTKS